MSETPADKDLLIDTVREFARRELLPRDRACDADESSLLPQVLPMLGEMGLMSLTLPAELGGLECSRAVYAEILSELAYASPSTAVTVSVHTMVGEVLNTFAREPHRTQWLSRWNSPESLASFAISEAGAGSDVSSARTSAERVAGGFRVNGEKMWITNGLTARWFMTLVRHDPADRKGGLSVVVVDGNEPGFARTPIHGKTGIRGSETAVIHLTDVFVPHSHLLGELGDGMKVCLSALDGGRVGIAAQALGIAEACLDEMVRYARTRQQFDAALSRLQAVQFMIADSAVEVAAARELIRWAATSLDQGTADPATSSKAKLYASEAANRIAYRAVQVHGGTGYVRESRVEQLARDARVTTIYEGASEIQRLVIARQLGAGEV